MKNCTTPPTRWKTSFLSLPSLPGSISCFSKGIERRAKSLVFFQGGESASVGRRAFLRWRDGGKYYLSVSSSLQRSLIPSLGARCKWMGVEYSDARASVPGHCPLHPGHPPLHYTVRSQFLIIPSRCTGAPVVFSTLGTTCDDQSSILKEGRTWVSTQTLLMFRNF